MKKFFLMIGLVTVLASCCNSKSVMRVKTPKRPAGQEDVIGLTAEPMDTVRIGIIGIGMRGRGAVYRMSRIEGPQIVAIADLLKRAIRAAIEGLTE